MKNKMSKSQTIFTVFLAVLIVVTAGAASMMVGCNNDKNDSNKETQIVTEIEEYTYIVDKDGNTIAPTDENGNTLNVDDNNSASSENGDSNSSGNSENNDSSGSAASNNSSSNNSNSSSKTSSNNSTNNSSSNKTSSNKTSSGRSSKTSSNSGSGNTSSEAGSSQSSNSSGKSLSIDGKKFNVGDTVTAVYYVKAPKKLENYQATVTYNSKYLSVENAELGTVASSGGIINYKPQGKILFNGSNISTGYNFTKKTELVTVTYKVKASGTTSTKLNMEVATGQDGTKFVEDGKTVNGFSTSKEYTKNNSLSA